VPNKIKLLRIIFITNNFIANGYTCSVEVGAVELMGEISVEMTDVPRVQSFSTVVGLFAGERTFKTSEELSFC
jgi:vacuolar-type H+-ATPase catalytic subunit A/Vma1